MAGKPLLCDGGWEALLYNGICQDGWEAETRENYEMRNEKHHNHDI